MSPTIHGDHTQFHNAYCCGIVLILHACSTNCTCSYQHGIPWYPIMPWQHDGRLKCCLMHECRSMRHGPLSTNLARAQPWNIELFSTHESSHTDRHIIVRQLAPHSVRNKNELSWENETICATCHGNRMNQEWKHVHQDKCHVPQNTHEWEHA